MINNKEKRNIRERFVNDGGELAVLVSGEHGSEKDLQRFEKFLGDVISACAQLVHHLGRVAVKLPNFLLRAQ